MRFSISRVMATIVVGLLLSACAPASSPAPLLTPSGSPAAIPGPTGATSGASPTLAPLPASASLPVRASARENSNHAVVTAPGPEGGLYVLIPMRVAPAVLALLDSSGRPRAGWPVVVPGATFCDGLLPVEDGSVRVVCTLENPDGNMFDPIGAFAFDSNARSLAGWPVEVQGNAFDGRVIGDALTLVAQVPGSDVIVEGQPTYEAGLMTVGPDGAITSGVRVPMGQTCCGDVWAVGPDSLAYGVMPATNDPSPQARVSSITSIEPAGVSAGWPVAFEGISSGPAFGPGGQTAVLVGDVARNTSRALVVDRDGEAISASSAELPIATVEYSGDVGGCTVGSPQAPLVAQDGTTFIYSELDTALYALEPSLAIKPGWPFDPAVPLVRARPGFESEHEAGYCPEPAIPAVGPDGTLYLPLQARNSSVGGSIVAVGPDGLVRPGWPVELERSRAEFWSVVVGPDGTVYALAIEPEPDGASSASILAIAPDSTVLYTTTIIDP